MQKRNVKTVESSVVPQASSTDAGSLPNPGAIGLLAEPIARHDLPRLDLLRSFEAVARRLSITQAAEELALTQSAVSRQIQQMEVDLGLPLFLRHHRVIELTQAGHILHRAVADSLVRLSDATRSIRAGSRTRQVAVTTTPGFASLWLIPRLARFTAGHTQLDVRVSATLEKQDIERHGFDVAVRYGPLKTGIGNLLIAEHVAVVCAPALLENPLRPLKTPADLFGQRLLSFDPAHGLDLSSDWQPWLKLMGLPDLLGQARSQNTLHFTQYADAVTAAVAGQGVALGRLALIEDLLRDKRLVVPFNASVASAFGFFVLLSRSGQNNPDALDFVAWLRSEAALRPASELTPVF